MSRVRRQKVRSSDCILVWGVIPRRESFALPLLGYHSVSPRDVVIRHGDEIISIYFLQQNTKAVIHVAFDVVALNHRIFLQDASRHWLDYRQDTVMRGRGSILWQTTRTVRKIGDTQWYTFYLITFEGIQDLDSQLRTRTAVWCCWYDIAPMSKLPQPHPWRDHPYPESVLRLTHWNLITVFLADDALQILDMPIIPYSAASLFRFPISVIRPYSNAAWEFLRLLISGTSWRLRGWSSTRTLDVSYLSIQDIWRMSRGLRSVCLRSLKRCQWMLMNAKMDGWADGAWARMSLNIFVFRGRTSLLSLGNEHKPSVSTTNCHLSLSRYCQCNAQENEQVLAFLGWLQVSI